MPEADNLSALSPWFRVHPERFVEERSGLEAMGFVLDEKGFVESDRVVFTGCLPEYPDRSLIVSFPWVYPSIAPDVSDDGTCLLLPRHQRADSRAYCLYGPGGESWWAGLDAVHSLGETKLLIDDVLGSGGTTTEGDPFPEPFSAQAIFGSHGTLLVPPTVSDFLPDDLTKACEGFFRIRYDVKSQGKGCSRGVVVEAQFKGKADKATAPRGYLPIVNGPEFKGRLTYLPTLSGPIRDGEGLSAILKHFGLTTQCHYGWHAVIFPEQSGDRFTSRFSWLLFKLERDSKLTPVRTHTYRSAERSARIPGLDFLAEKRIAVIGCGSIGSKIACSLASSGVSKFYLVDKDAMEPANSVRHECGVSQFGYPKVDALAARIVSLNPDALGGCEGYRGNPFGDISPEAREGISAKLRECDLILDATGNQCLSRAICRIGRTFSRPSVHVSVTNGAWSGEVFRSRPGSSACWTCFQTAFEDSPPGEAASHDHVFGPGCDQPTFTGTGYELDIVSGLATSFAVDTLRSLEGTSSEYDGDYLLWEGRDHSGKLILKTAIHQVPTREICAVCKPHL